MTLLMCHNLTIDRRTTLKTLTFITTLLLSTAAMSDEGPFSVSGNVALTNDYRFRGLEQTDGGPAIQGGFDVEHTSGFYAGVWASNVELGGDGTIEMDYYGGYTFDITKNVSGDVGYIYYDYPQNGDITDDFDFAEWYGSVSFFGATVGYAYSDDFFGNAGTAHYVYTDYTHELPAGFGLDLHVGHSSISSQSYFATSEEDYTDYSVGVTKEVMGVTLGVAYVGTDLDSNIDSTDKYGNEGVVFSISKSM